MGVDGRSRGWPRVLRALPCTLASFALAAIGACAERPLAAVAPCTRTSLAQRFVLDPPMSTAGLSRLEIVVVLPSEPSTELGDAIDAELARARTLLSRGQIEDGGRREYRPLDGVGTRQLLAPTLVDAQRGLLEIRGDEHGVGLAVVELDDALACGEHDEVVEGRLARARRESGGATDSVVFLQAGAACAADVRAAIEDLLTEAARDRCPIACVPHRNPPTLDGLRQCDVYELLPEGSALDACARLPGREPLDVVQYPGSEPQPLCRVVQLTPQVGAADGEPGWFYDDASATLARVCGNFGVARIVVTTPATPLPGSQLRLVCVDLVIGAGQSAWCTSEGWDADAPCAAGMHCDPSSDRCAAGGADDGPTLRCDAVTDRCAHTCASDDDCGSDEACDLRTLEEAAGASARRIPEPRRAELRGACVRPTCG